MKPSDIVRQLQLFLPKETPLFTTVVQANIVVASGIGTITFVSAGAYDPKVNETFLIFDSLTLIGLTSPTFGDGATTGITTISEHDLTLRFTKTVTLRDTFGGLLDGTFNLTAVPTSTSFEFADGQNPGIFVQGSLEQAGSLNGAFGIATIATKGSVFTFDATGIPDQITADPVDLHFAPRVTAAPTFERALELYTEQGKDQFWMFVVPGSSVASKDRDVLSDAQNSRVEGNDLKTHFVEPYSFFVFAPAIDQLAAEDVMDICRGDLLQPILKAIMGVEFDQNVSQDKFYLLMATGHQIAFYQNAVYVHEYMFENSYNVTNDDRFVPFTKAFRNIDFTFTFGTDTKMTAHEDLP